MFYFLSKAIDFFVMPFSIFFILCILGFRSKHKKRKQRFFIIAFGWLYLTSNNYLVNEVFNAWEYDYKNISDIQKPCDVGIVLSGGMIGVSAFRSDHPVLGVHADRFSEAFLLYKAGKIKKILITGISPKALLKQKKGEVRLAAQLLVQWGVKPEDIILEEKARNTHENAVFTSKILNSAFPGQRYLLITSSFHMRRALGCFTKAKVNADVFPADFYGGRYAMTFKDYLIPDPDAQANFELLWREWVGYVMYKIAGYC